MTEYIVSTETRPEVMIERGMETITRCADCDNYRFGFCFRFVNGSYGRFRAKPTDYCSWGIPKS